MSFKNTGFLQRILGTADYKRGGAGKQVFPPQLMDSSLRTRKMVSEVLPRAAASCLRAPCTVILLKVGPSALTQALITACFPMASTIPQVNKNTAACLCSLLPLWLSHGMLHQLEIQVTIKNIKVNTKDRQSL